MKIYQLQAKEPGEPVITLTITHEWFDMREAVSLAVGRRCWSLEDLTISVWSNGVCIGTEQA